MSEENVEIVRQCLNSLWCLGAHNLTTFIERRLRTGQVFVDVDVVHGPAEQTGATRVREGTMVPCDTLQTLIGKEDLPGVRLIKIDVEGAE
jgi:hypothetical protein